MNQIYSTFRGRLLILVLSMLPCLSTYAQKKYTPAIQDSVREQVKFLTHAPVLIPQLLHEKAYDSIDYFLENWENDGYRSDELIFAIRILSAIETGKTDSLTMPCDALLYLSEYARELYELQTKGEEFHYHIKLAYVWTNKIYSYDATPEVSKLLLFLRQWAIRLKKRSMHDAEERFFCQVYSGEIQDPKLAISENPRSCPPIARMQAALEAHNDSAFRARRDRWSGTTSMGFGIWIPTNHLRSLGAHPSWGFAFGVRNKLNEFDLATFLRFANAPQKYSYVYDSSLLASNYYLGGIIELEYTRYLVHQKYFDLGLTGGIGYDFFDGPPASDDENASAEFEIGSFNFNTGFRLKYFFRRHGFIGLTAKYNLIQYKNNGGTNLDGNAWTLELVYGSH